MIQSPYEVFSMYALLNGGLDCPMKFDMSIISLVLIFYLHNFYRGFLAETFEDINQIMNTIIRYCTH